MAVHHVSQAPFEAVYAARFAFVRRTLVRLGVPRAELDDALQETFVAAFRHWGDFREGADERAWLFGIARRIAFRYRRSAARRAKLVRAYDPPDEGPPPPDCAVAERQAAGMMQAFLDSLSPRKREVFVLSRLEGMTGVEVAAALDINANTMWSRLRSAQDELDRFVRMHRARVGPRLAGEPSREEPRGRARMWMLVLAKLPLALKPVAAAAALLALALGLTSPTAVVQTAPTTVDRPSVPTPTAAATPPSEPSARSKPMTHALLTTPVRASMPPTRRAPQRARSKAAPSPHPANPTPSPPDDSSTALAEEAALIRGARTALRRHDGALALQRLDEHERRFPSGVLAPERRALKVRASCIAGQDGAARRLARAAGPSVAAVADDGCRALLGPAQRSTKTGAAGEDNQR